VNFSPASLHPNLNHSAGIQRKDAKRQRRKARLLLNQKDFTEHPTTGRWRKKFLVSVALSSRLRSFAPLR